MQGNIDIPDSTITSALTFRNLVLMNMQQLTNFPYIEKDFDALTDYELLCLVVKFLNDVIANQNEQNDSIRNMYNAFLELQTYVNNTKDTLEDAFNNLDDYVRNYFANLDVQDEINNKLDQMLEDGVLTEIIQQFLQTTAIWCFDTVDDMKDATNLINGSYAKTLGYYEINDDGGATYKITNTASLTDYQEELDSGLYATLLHENILNVKQFGAKGDNSTDNTTILKYLFETLAKDGDTIYFPKGQYIYSDQITCNKFIHIEGQAWRPHNYNFCVIKNNGEGGILLTVRTSSVENIDFIGNSNYSSAYGLRFNAGRPSIINCTIAHFELGTGLIIGGNDSNYYTDEFQIHNVLVSYCDIGIEMGSQLHPGTELADNNAGLVSNLMIGQCRVGIYMRNSFSNNFLSLIIDTCSEYGIYMENSRYNFFLNPYLECTKNIYFDSTSRDNKIFGNRGYGYLTQYDGIADENMIMGNAQDKGIKDLFTYLKSEKLLIGKRQNNGYFDFTHSGHTLNILHSQSGGTINFQNTDHPQNVKVDNLYINANSNTKLTNLKSLIGPIAETEIAAKTVWSYTRNDSTLDLNNGYNFWHGDITFYPSLPSSVISSVECREGKITIKLYNTADVAVTINEGTYTVLLNKNYY